MKSKLIIAALLLALPFVTNADRYGHRGGHHHGGGNQWIAPAIIGGAIVGSAIYGITRDDEPQYENNDRYYRRELTQRDIREEQLRRREIELERREHEYYERQNRARGYNRENCREYYRDDGNSNYYSKNCW
ncbi:MAG: hypothetical protein EXR89_05340 [Methylococcaceae bacterium]|nr:hypothetical protein [Methylococcaceae bacterium]